MHGLCPGQIWGGLAGGLHDKLKMGPGGREATVRLQPCQKQHCSTQTGHPQLPNPRHPPLQPNSSKCVIIPLQGWGGNGRSKTTTILNPMCNGANCMAKAGLLERIFAKHLNIENSAGKQQGRKKYFMVSKDT